MSEEVNWEFYIVEWDDIAHYLSQKNPRRIPCWFRPNPVNQIVSIREGRETEKQLHEAIGDYQKRRFI